MLDFGMAFATLAKLPPHSSCATVNLTTSFIRPAPKGAYVVTGQVDRCGKSLAFTQARLVSLDSGALVATGSSSLVVIGL
jgi:acyl-coenzyme A thioesterase PaaI-like protein